MLWIRDEEENDIIRTRGEREKLLGQVVFQLDLEEIGQEQN